MNDIKVYEQLTHVTLKDWRVLTTKKTPDQLFAWLDEHPFILIEWEMHSRYSIISAKAVNLDDLESLIVSQSKEIQELVRAKRNRLKTEMWKDMTVSYAKNYIKSLLDSEETNNEKEGWNS